MHHNIIAAAILAVAILGAAALNNLHPPGRYESTALGTGSYLRTDRSTGQVALCVYGKCKVNLPAGGLDEDIIELNADLP